MKKMFAKLGMPSLLTLAFLLFGMFFGSNLQAQALTAAAPNTGNIKVLANWKTSTNALQALASEIASLDAILSSTGGTPALKMKYTIYVETKSLLEGGLEVPVAATTAFYHYAPGAGTDAAVDSPLNQSEWNSIYSSLISLLSV
jgi:hypothetical protein